MRKTLLFALVGCLLATPALATDDGYVLSDVRDATSRTITIITPSNATGILDTCAVWLKDADWQVAVVDTADGTTSLVSAAYGTADFQYELPIFVHAEGVTASMDSVKVSIDLGNDGVGWLNTGGWNAEVLVEGTPETQKLTAGSPTPYTRFRIENECTVTGVWKVTLTYPVK